MKSSRRIAAASTLAFALLAVTVPVAAEAGTLSAASFSTAPGYAHTGATNVSYDWGFTTATAATVSGVTMSVPPGTSAVADRHLALPGIGGNYARTPDSPSNSVTSDIDVRLKLRLADWTPPANVTPASKVSGDPNRSWNLRINTDGSLRFLWYPSGTSASGLSQDSSVLGIPDGSTRWIRATMDVDNGAGSRVVSFYTSLDGSSWTLVSGHTTPGVTAIADGAADLEVGALFSGTVQPLKGDVYAFRLHNGIDGPVVSRFDPNEADPLSPNSWVSSTGETWTVGRSGTNAPADIAADLNVTGVTGLPSDGAAFLRMIDGNVLYQLNVPTATAAAAQVTISIGGLINTGTAGNYASTITTYDSSGPPALAVDSVTTSASLSITALGATATATVMVEPSLTFGVVGRSSACNGALPTPASTSSATTLDVGVIYPGSNGIAAQTLDVVTNAPAGSTVYVRTLSGSSLAGVPGTNDSPDIFPAVGNEALGYTTSDSSLSGPTPDRFTNGGAKWASLSSSNEEILKITEPADVSECLAIQAGASNTTAAGTYILTIAYMAVGHF